MPFHLYHLHFPINTMENVLHFQVKNMARVAALALALALALMFVNLTGLCSAQLQVGYYRDKCRYNVELIVRNIIQAKISRDPTIVAALLRLHFHDCFVRGCDASILLDGTNSEKSAPPNLSVRGYDIVNAAKAVVEFLCPGVVSCADIIAMATRDSVFFSKGGFYNVETGRKDGLVSNASEVNLPSPTIPIPQAVDMFNKNNLNVVDMVYLLGGHTVGVAHCALFQDRLYNFNNTGQPDPTMDRTLLNTLRNRCPQNSDGSNTTNLDQNPDSAFVVDNSYYQEIVAHKGILQFDQQMAIDPITASIVAGIARDSNFNYNFGQAIIKMGRINVLTGNQGQIRTFCNTVRES